MGLFCKSLFKVATVAMKEHTCKQWVTSVHGWVKVEVLTSAQCDFGLEYFGVGIRGTSRWCVAGTFPPPEERCAV